jgi:hypothetical protein
VHVLHDALDGLMLVDDSVNPEGPYRGSPKSGKQHPADRVSQGIPEASLQGLDDELAGSPVLGKLRDLYTLRKHQSSQI